MVEASRYSLRTIYKSASCSSLNCGLTTITEGSGDWGGPPACAPRGAMAGESGQSSRALLDWPAEETENTRRRKPAENATKYLDMANQPYSGERRLSLFLSLSLSESFFFPPKIPKILGKGFFFFSVAFAALSVGAGPWPVASGGRLGSYFGTVWPSGVVWGGFGSPPPKMWERNDPVDGGKWGHPGNCEHLVAAEPTR